MNAEDYLSRFHHALKDFQPEEQKEMMAEIASHIEDGQEDETRGEDAEPRLHRTMAEMGSPEELGKGFHAVYRPNRWVDFLLIFMPAYFLPPAVHVISRWLSSSSAILDENQFISMSIRLMLLVGLFMVFVSTRRHSLLLFAFWAPDVISRLITLMVRQSRWLPGQTAAAEAFAPLEVALYTLLLAGMSYWLARTIWRNRTNYLIILFVLQPIIGTFFGGFTTQYSLSHGLSPDYPNWSFWGIGLQNAVQALSLAGFLLLKPRDLRWLAFFFGMVDYTVFMLVTYWPDPVMVILWAVYSLLLPAFWIADVRRRGFIEMGQGVDRSAKA